MLSLEFIYLLVSSPLKILAENATTFPLSYDDSLSYYELLCKLIDYINHANEDIANLQEEVAELKERIGEWNERKYGHWS